MNIPERDLIYAVQACLLDMAAIREQVIPTGPVYQAATRARNTLISVLATLTAPSSTPAAS